MTINKGALAATFKKNAVYGYLATSLMFGAGLVAMVGEIVAPSYSETFNVVANAVMPTGIATGCLMVALHHLSKYLEKGAVEQAREQRLQKFKDGCKPSNDMKNDR